MKNGVTVGSFVRASIGVMHWPRITTPLPFSVNLHHFTGVGSAGAVFPVLFQSGRHIPDVAFHVFANGVEVELWAWWKPGSEDLAVNGRACALVW